MKKHLALVACFSLIATLAVAYPKICLDPGHGGSDPGAVGGGLEEADMVLDKCNKFKAWLDLDTSDSGGGYAWSVIRTRSTDVYVSLSGRTSFANSNSADRFMCTHNNAHADTSANGMETFSYQNGTTSANLRNSVQYRCRVQWPITNRGNKTAGFYVLVYTNMPAELHEAAFITNSGDRAYISSSTHRDNNAKGQLHAIQVHYGYSAYTPSAGGGDYIADDGGGSSYFVASSNWWTSSYTPGYYGSGYHVRNTESVSDGAVWKKWVPSNGNYEFKCRWTSGSNRASNAAYICYHTGGSTTKYKNQRTGGGAWSSLGTYNITYESQNRVLLSCWTSSGDVVIADAIMLSN